MGEASRRKRAFGNRISALERYVHSYLFALKALVSALPEGTDLIPVDDRAILGRAEIWPCADGAAVVLIYHDPQHAGDVITHDVLTSNLNDFMRTLRVSALYDDTGLKYPYEVVLTFNDIGHAGVTFWGKQVHDTGGDRVFKSRYQTGMVFGRQSPLPQPDEQALIDFKAAYSIRNLAPVESTRIVSYEEKREVSGKEAAGLAEEFSRLLSVTTLEKEPHEFLRRHPEFIYPDYIKSHSKFPLGGEKYTDFVVLVQGPQGIEYIFVEIERTDKPIFTKQGQFSAEYTQAYDQLLTWENWIAEDRAFLTKRLPGLYKPKYHLIMGRGVDLSQEERAKIHNAFTGNKIFSTYDDLLDRFRRIIAHLLR